MADLMSLTIVLVGMVVVIGCYCYAVLNEGSEKSRVELARAHKVVMDLAEAYLDEDPDRKIKRVREMRAQVLMYHEDNNNAKTATAESNNIVLAFSRKSTKGET